MERIGIGSQLGNSSISRDAGVDPGLIRLNFKYAHGIAR